MAEKVGQKIILKNVKLTYLLGKSLMLIYTSTMNQPEGGFSIVELLLTIVILGIMTLSSAVLMIALLHSAQVAKRQATALTLATNQMEYLKSLPYDNLAVTGGAIPAATTIPATFNTRVNGDKYLVKTSIVYVDNAFDGCGSYPSQALKQLYCRDYPPPSGAPATDTNPADYKDVTVQVFDVSGLQLALLDTNISARVAETASNTGALFVKIVDASGAPISGAGVNVTNSVVSPAVNVSDVSDNNGITIFYGLPPDTSGTNYIASASLNGYSSLTSLSASGSLQPTYPSVSLIAQNASYITLTLKPQGNNSLVIESTDVSGAPLANVKVYAKGGYKRYTSNSDTSYYYDNLRGSDSRPVTDASGLASITNLVPGDYVLCGDTGSTSCTIGSSTYYLAAALPYGGINPFNPVTVPTYSAASPPTTTFAYNSASYLQKVRLMLTPISNFPRILSVAPYTFSQAAGNLATASFTVKGANLPCSATATSCSTQIKLLQGSNTYVASCTGANTGVSLNCTINLSSVAVGPTQLVVIANGYTLTLPLSSPPGGINVTP